MEIPARGANGAQRASTHDFARSHMASCSAAICMLRCDGRPMNTYAAMSRHRFVALTIPTRRCEFRVGMARERRSAADV
jgi:hypothetical protein